MSFELNLTKYLFFFILYTMLIIRYKIINIIFFVKNLLIDVIKKNDFLIIINIYYLY